MALGSTQPLTEISTRNISWGERQPVCRADNLNTFMCWLSWNLGVSASWNYQACPYLYRDLFTFAFVCFVCC